LGPSRVALDDLARFAIYNLGAFSRLGGSSRGQLSFAKLVRTHQAPALYAYLEYDVSWA
jgi:hypothetical protein